MNWTASFRLAGAGAVTSRVPPLSRPNGVAGGRAGKVVHWCCLAVAVTGFPARDAGLLTAQESESPPASPQGPIIETVAFPGRAWVPRERILQVSGLVPGERLRPETATEAYRRLVRWPWLSRVAPPRVTPAAAGRVRIEIDVTPRRIIGNLTFEGNTLFRELKLREAVPFQKGEPYEPWQLAEARARMEQLYHEEGYLFASIRASTEEAAGGRIDFRFVIDEDRRAYLRRVTLLGAHQVPAREALADLRTQERRLYGLLSPGYYVPEWLESDLQALEDEYVSRGFLDATVSLDGLELDYWRRSADLRLRVVEGERWVIVAVRVENNKLLPTALLDREHGLAAGEYYSADDVEAARRRIADFYQRNTELIPDVSVDLDYSEDKPEVTVTFVIRERPHLFVGRVRIEGNVVTRDRVIRQLSTLLPGGPLTQLEMERTAEALRRRGLFPEVQVYTERTALENVRDVVIRVKEEPDPGLLQAGGGATDGAGEVAYVRLSHSNFDLLRLPYGWTDWRGAFSGGGQTLDIELIPGTKESIYRMRFVEPYFFQSDFTLAVFGDTKIFEREGYEEKHLRGEARVTKKLDEDGMLTLGLSYVADLGEVRDLEPEAPADAFAARGETFLGYPRLQLRWDRRERNFYSGPSGWITFVRGDIGHSVTGSEVDFGRVVAGADAYLSWLDERPDYRHSLHVGVEAGWVDGPDLPLYERFYLGGSRSFRGFEYRRVGPHERDRPVGGRAMVRGTVEYSMPLFWREVRGVALFDWGASEPRLSQIDTGRLRTAAGGGVRFRLHVLEQPLAADLYFVEALSSETGDEEEVFNFRVGLSF